MESQRRGGQFQHPGCLAATSYSSQLHQSHAIWLAHSLTRWLAALWLACLFVSVSLQWKGPARPTLLSVLADGATVETDFPRSSNPQVLLRRNQVVDIVISGGAGGFNHPIHLHGHDFATISQRRNDRQVPSMVRQQMADFGARACIWQNWRQTSFVHWLKFCLSFVPVWLSRVAAARHGCGGRKSCRHALHLGQSWVRSQQLREPGTEA